MIHTNTFVHMHADTNAPQLTIGNTVWLLSNDLCMKEYRDREVNLLLEGTGVL